MIETLRSIELLFKERLDEALASPKLALSPTTEAYLVMRLAHPEKWRVVVRGDALAELFLSASNRQNPEVRKVLLKRVGDTSLLIASDPGWQMHFGWRNGRSLPHLPPAYFAKIGTAAYYNVGPEPPFDELADSRVFMGVAKALGRVWEELKLHKDSDLLATYDQWLATGDPVLASKLTRQGVVLPERSDAKVC